MKRSNKATTAILSALLLLILAVTGTQPLKAQTPPHTPTGIQIQSCHKLCVKGGETCLAEAGGTEPYCDTLEIGCVSGCDACIGIFDTCIKSEDQTPRFCQGAFDECLERKLTAARSRARPQITFKGGDGLSQKTAVVIEGALSGSEGILAESLWIARHHADWRKREQTRLSLDGRDFDSINYQAADGPHMIWFDITGFFGK
jgi:hypothetical protein